MSQLVPTAQRTLVTALSETLADAAAYNRSEMEPPAVVLWPDRERQWERVVPLLRPQLPHLLTLGAYDQHTSTGPAVWLKCAIARRLEEVPIANETVPILYLPGWSRADLRDVEGCPSKVQPLVELQFRGVWFTQQNNKDWTVLAYLVSKETGLGLEVARDAATLDALQHTLVQLARAPIEELAAGVLDHDALNRLAYRDPERALLDWLDEANGVHERERDSWQSFRSICRQRYAFDPESDGRLVAAERLGTHQGNWEQVWGRYAEAPQSWPRIPELLRQAQPAFAGSLFDDRSAWPSENDSREAALRSELASLAGAGLADAVIAVERLEKEHGERRVWVWSRLGQAPLAWAMSHLARLAEAVASTLPGATRDELAASYRSVGWTVDAAAVDALGSVSAPADEQAVKAAVRALYLPWLQSHAERLQVLAKADPLPGISGVEPVDKGTCLLFVDGMRFDIGQRLATAMVERGWEVSSDWRWSALPTVTATAKPASSPVRDLVSGGVDDAEFGTRVADTGASLTPDRFRQLLSQRRITYLTRNEHGDPSGTAWTEIGDIDHRGHDEGARLARRVRECVEDVVSRVGELLDAGWARVRLVTDHGWLLMPGGLPKVHLPAYLAASRWGRCAVLRENAKVDVPVVPWHWSPDVRVGLAPGVSVFYEGTEYAHGGLTLQEALVPELTVSRTAAVAASAKISEVRWTGLRCRVQIDGSVTGLRVDIRRKPADGTSSFAAAKDVIDAGQASVIIPDDDDMGAAAFVVLLDSAGRVISKQATTIGGD